MSAEADLITRLRAWCDRWQEPLLMASIAIALELAWFGRWVNDDAFISFNYAQALTQGDGLTWFGVKVEGYTNFL